MAKALVGYMSAGDPRAVARLSSENRRLRERVADLEAVVLRLQAQNDALSARLERDGLLTVAEMPEMPEGIEVRQRGAEDMQPV